MTSILDVRTRYSAPLFRDKGPLHLNSCILASAGNSFDLESLGTDHAETTCIEVALMSYHTKQLDAAIKARSLVSVQTVVLFDNTTLVLLQQTDRVNSKLCMRPV